MTTSNDGVALTATRPPRSELAVPAREPLAHTLDLVPGVQLDPDYVGGGAFAVLGKRNAGKTYTGRVMAEALWSAGVPFVAFDPMGKWWGLRSSADGTKPGIPVAIFGGDHGDVPLDPSSGALVADIVLDEGLSAILDLSRFGSHEPERDFVHDFLNRLYRRNRELIHLLFDEADLYAPQRAGKDDQDLLRVMEDTVRRGRNHGLGSTFLTQRPAALNKGILTQVDGLIVMRTIGYNDRQAIDLWIKGHADPDAARELNASLAGLATGECWYWIPELDLMIRAKIRPARTFDSSATRKRGENPRTPRGFADLDLAAIKERMGTIDVMTTDDPDALRREVERLRQQLQTRPQVTVSVIEEGDVQDLRTLVGELADLTSAINDTARTLGTSLGKVSAPHPPAIAQAASVPARDLPAPPALDDRPAGAPAPPPAPADDQPPAGVSLPQQRILDALAALADIGIPAPTRLQLALFAKVRPKSSAYANSLAAARTAGLVDYPAVRGTVALTPTGRALANGERAAPATLHELHDYVRTLLTEPRWRLLAHLISAYPERVDKATLARAAAVSLSSSGFANNLSALRSLGLVDYPEPGYIVARSVLFPPNLPR